MNDHNNDLAAQDATARARRLIGFFDHPERVQRHRALEQVIQMGHLAVPALIETLRAPEKRRRAGSLRALAHMGPPAALPALMDYVDTHTTEIGDNRAFAMQGVSQATSPDIRDPHRLFAFLQRHTNDADHFVRAFTYEALGRLGDPRALGLVQRGARDKEPFVAEKASAAAALLQIAPIPTAVAADALMSMDEVGFALQSGQAERRNMGMDELTRRAAEGQSVDQLLIRLLTGPNRLGRQSAMEAFARLRQPQHLPLVAQNILNTTHDDDLLTRALRALAAYGPTACAQRLPAEQRHDLLRRIKGLLSSPDVFVRAAAVAASGSLPGQPSVELLLRAVHDQNAWVREDATDALVRHAGPDLAPYIDKLARLTTHALTDMEGHTTATGGDGAGSDNDLERFQSRLLDILIETTAAAPLPRDSDGLLQAGLAALGGTRARLRLKGLDLLTELADAGLRPRFASGEIRVVASALTSSRPAVVRQGIRLLADWLPKNNGEATASIVHALRQGDEAAALELIPLLATAGDIEARQVLRALSRNDNPTVARAAQDAMTSGW